VHERRHRGQDCAILWASSRVHALSILTPGSFLLPGVAVSGDEKAGPSGRLSPRARAVLVSRARCRSCSWWRLARRLPAIGRGVVERGHLKLVLAGTE
jgi:hypothetical protein